MKYEREYLLKADLREVIYEWDAVFHGREKLVEAIFYRLLHAGDLKDERPTYMLKDLPDGREWVLDVSGLTDKEKEEKIQKAMGKIRDHLTVKFTPKGLKMKVDADSPFKGETI